MKQVAFDESGNSGSNLIRPEEPLLVLSSVCLTPEQISDTEICFSHVKADEWKFAKFRRNPKHLAALGSLLARDWMSTSTVKTYVIHKRFMAVTKMVDLIHEPLARQHGVDLYEQGAAVALANLFVTVLPTFLGHDGLDRLLQSFVALVREPTEETFENFEVEVAQAYELLGRMLPDLATSFCPFIIGCQQPDFWLPYLAGNELDPLIPSYYTLIDAWGQQLKADFEVVSDESKTLAGEMERLRQFSDPELLEKRIPGVGGWVHFPLRARQIVAVDSKSSRAVQIADLLAGAANSVFSTSARHEKMEPWQEQFRDVFFAKQLLAGGIWPSSDVTPEAVGAEHVVGEKAADYSTRVLKGDPRTRRQ